MSQIGAKNLTTSEASGILEAVSSAFMTVEFDLSGKFIEGNDVFLRSLGYSKNDLRSLTFEGLFEQGLSNFECKKIFKDLTLGVPKQGAFSLTTNDDSTVWGQGALFPVHDTNGGVEKIVAVLSDVTESKVFDHENEALVDAVSKSQAVIEFKLDATIVKANDNFLNTLGYSSNEIVGKKHKMFCKPEFANSPQYNEMWETLRSGQSVSGEFCRVKKDGSEVWISAAYTPIVDSNGKVQKVVKFASDITKTKMMTKFKQMVDLSPINTMLAAPDGTLIYMNENTRNTLKKFEAHLPDRVDNLVGQKIDIFHKKPEVQRNLIKDASQMPIKKIIDFHDQKFELLVSPINDVDGTYIGPMVTWEVVTQKVKLIEDLSETAENLSSAAHNLLEVATTMSANAEETTAQSNTVATGSEEVTAGIQTVAANVEEMNASIREITKSTNESSSKSSNALEKANNSNEIIGKLGESSMDVGNIIKVISSIAQQTNLLALNATIEAARAGEAGKGFAVVANEVKELAKQTANATQDITKKIENIQEDSKLAVDSVSEIGQVIEELNNISASIAASVEEQAASTNEVSRVVQESAESVKSISANITQVSEAAENTGRGANSTKEAAENLAQIAEKLRNLVTEIKLD